jgi:hypothetical protein
LKPRLLEVETREIERTQVLAGKIRGPGGVGRKQYLSDLLGRNANGECARRKRERNSHYEPKDHRVPRSGLIVLISYPRNSAQLIGRRPTGHD